MKAHIDLRRELAQMPRYLLYRAAAQILPLRHRCQQARAVYSAFIWETRLRPSWVA